MSRRRNAVDDAVDPIVTMARADPHSRFYDPRHARPLSPPSSGGWGEIDTAFLDEVRPPVPAFPLDLLPPFWRDWILDTAGALGAPVDYVAQSVLAAVSGLCGAGASVRIGPRWVEPLVLWQALVGAPSSGKSPAMAAVAELLATLDAEKAKDAADGEGPRVLVEETSLGAVVEAVAASPRGVVLWRDDGSDWLAGLRETVRPQWLRAWSARPLTFANRRIERFAVSLLLALSTERLAGLATGEEFASRFLFAWPTTPEHRPLGAARPARDTEALAALRRIAWKAGTPDSPLELVVDQRGLKAFDGFLGSLATELREGHEPDGLEMAWLGKGRGSVARLAGVLELLAWSELGANGPPGHLGAEQIERGVRLWSDYFRPHAFGLFHRLVPSEGERQARRVVRWLRQRGLGEVSREQVRVEALQRAVDAADVEQVLYRLQAAGIVSRVHYSHPSRGRPPNRWWVNPRLTTTLAVGNAGNADKSSEEESSEA